MSAFPHITHWTLRSSSHFHETEGYCSLVLLPAFPCLRHLTLDFAFEDAVSPGTRGSFTWLLKPSGRADRLLLISVFDRSIESLQDADRYLFRCYKELQQCGEFDEISSRLNEFVRWQADVDDVRMIEVGGEVDAMKQSLQARKAATKQIHVIFADGVHRESRSYAIMTWLLSIMRLETHCPR
ncbi:hypothetical protein BJ138DRAFT_513224 [Hygrophoropsis aurantiaca]|uniref:Uncharacterized protein n=1 Tax=Hygrophoropsis aurantiaca TaxID=72124 RepID=A0ACB8A1N3_9AGAM|nr:hypothetical protein BJ138DRAFT_513224 [Hygrophoropsis aurantiaca]